MYNVTTRRVLCVPSGWILEPTDEETVLDAALRIHRPLASSCAGRAVCGDCLVRVVDGSEHVNAPDSEECAWRLRRGYTGDERLACCLRISGPVSVTTRYW